MFTRPIEPLRTASQQARHARELLEQASYAMREAIAQIGLLPGTPRNASLGEKARELEAEILALERRV